MIPDYALYQKELFVGRKKELELVDRRVREALRGGVGLQSVICLFGIRGIGKTWLIAEIARRYQDRPNVAVFKHDFTCDGALTANLIRDVESRLQGGAVPLILLESVDQLPEEDFLELEEENLEPIVLTNRAIIIVTSRRRIRKWNRFQVRRRILLERLEPLSDLGTPSFEEVQELLRNWRCDQARARIVPGLACGHPYTVQVLAQTPDEKPAVVLCKVVNSILEETPVELQLIVEALAPLRVFGVESMRPVLAEAINTLYADASDGKLLDLIGDLLGAGIVEWNSERGRYLIVPPLRCLLHRKLELTKLDELRRWHQAALEFLLERLQRLPTHTAVFLREIPYHAIWARPEQAAEELKQLLDEVLVAENFEGDEAHELLSALERDTELLGKAPEICLHARARVKRFCQEAA